MYAVNATVPSIRVVATVLLATENGQQRLVVPVITLVHCIAVTDPPSASKTRAKHRKEHRLCCE